MNRNLFIFALILIVLVVIAFFTFGNIKQATTGGKTANINGHTIKLEIADQPNEQMKGLSNRNSLADDVGMLFTFPQAGYQQFWMKDMKFPLDIIYLNGEKVVTIYDSIPAFNQVGNTKTPNLTIYTPTDPANNVLEINAGLAKKYDLKVGDTVKLNL